MSAGVIKWGETYDSIVENILPYVNTLTQPNTVGNRIKWGETYDNLAAHIVAYLPTMVPKQNKRKTIRWGQTYQALSEDIAYKLSGNTFNSSLYPIWWNSVITIYNRYENPVTQQITWYRHYLFNCFRQNARTQMVNGQTVYNSNNIIIRIPQNNRYAEYKDWINIPNVNQGSFFTLHSGDIIVDGIVTDIINEYTSGKRSDDIRSKYKDLGICITINSWQNNTGSGRVCPHYYVSGE